LTAGSHREYRYTAASLSEVTKDKIKLVRNEKLNPASAAVKKEFQDIYQYIPNKVLKRVVFPEPFLPNTHSISPLFTDRFTSLSTGFW